MASGSLGSTTRICGTKVNAVVIDEWTTWDCNQAQAGVEKLSRKV